MPPPTPKTMMPFRSFPDVRRHLDALGMFHMDLGLDRMRRVLRALDLHRAPFVTVQVLGTNGKGSTSAFLAALCAAHGCRAGLYTSPHFVSPEERIRINGKPVPGSAWPAAANRVMAAADGEGLTYFEVLTVLSLLLFREAGVEVAILEAGLGGRHDATTAVAADLVCFTPIAMDHAAVLGPTLGHIARDKSAAIRNVAPVLTAPQFPAAAQALAAAAMNAGAELVAAPPLAAEWLPRLGLGGEHQLVNAGLAVGAWQKLAPLLGKTADDAGAQARGLNDAFLPGRLQVAPRTTEHPALVLDGAHNPHGMQALLRAMGKFRPPAAMVFSCLGDKDWRTSAAMLRRRYPESPVLVPALDNPRAADPKEVTAFLSAIPGAPATPLTGPDAPAQALSAAGGSARNTTGVTLVTGSLYLLAEIFARFPDLLDPSFPPAAEEHSP